MSKNNFIIYTFIYLALSSFFLLKVGPNMLKSGKAMVIKSEDAGNIKSINFSFHIASKQYLNVQFKTTKRDIKFQYYLPDNDQKKMIDILLDNNLIKGEQELLNQVPVVFDNNNLESLENIEVIYKKDELTFLSINGKTVLGSKNVLGRIIVIVLSYFIMVLGGLGLLIFPLNLFLQIRDNENSGKPIYVPNRLDGLKYILRFFRK
ncbi:hypothetical protein [Tenacibaculum sp. 190524A05c]|uniref:hypothetical protein n=1 Tax=Tenacibaculum platacis TaxID=3137852 RepID=UPI0032B2050D